MLGGRHRVLFAPRVTEEAKKFGLKAGEAWDLTEGWDFRLKSHREAALKYQTCSGYTIIRLSGRA